MLGGLITENVWGCGWGVLVMEDISRLRASVGEKGASCLLSAGHLHTYTHTHTHTHM